MYRQYPDELCHYGIKGMKWGVRRYQNPDGTRTELGKRRERKGAGDLSPEERAERRKKRLKTGAKVGGAAAGVVAANAAGRAAVRFIKSNQTVDRNWLFGRTVKDGKDKPNISPAEQIGKQAGKTVEHVGRAVGRVDQKRGQKREAERRASKKPEIARMTDDELRRRINRMQLEKQYLDLSRPESDGGWSTQEKIDLGTDIFNGLLAAGGLAVSLIALKQHIK